MSTGPPEYKARALTATGLSAIKRDYPQTFGPYRVVNTIRFGYKNQLVNAV